MWCDIAFYYKKENYVIAKGNVRMKQGDSISMRSQNAEYNGDTKFAFASGKVWLKKDTTTVTTDTMYFDRIKQQAYYRSGGVVTSPNSEITSRIGRYFIENDKISFINNVVVTNPEYIIESEQLDFYSKPEHAYLYGPTTITGENSVVYCERGFYDTKNDNGYFIQNSRIDYDNRQVFGDSLYFDRTTNFASATNNIRVLDTTNNSLIKGHYAEVYRAKDSVFITKRAVAITVEQQDSVYIHGDRLIVTGKPEERILRGYYNVRMFKSDLSGKCDSIHVDQKSGLTQMIRKPILWSGLSQMTGDSIHLIHDPVAEKLDSLKVFENSFIVQKDTKSKSASMTLIFEEKAIIDVYKYKGITGDIWPESQFPDQAQKLAGFNWRGDEQLLSKEDIFKGEPPFELVKIKGIPLPKIDEDFFEIPEEGEEIKIPSASDLLPKDLENRKEDKPKIGVEATEEDDTTKAYREYLESRSNINTAPKKPSPPLKKKTIDSISKGTL